MRVMFRRLHILLHFMRTNLPIVNHRIHVLCRNALMDVIWNSPGYNACHCADHFPSCLWAANALESLHFRQGTDGTHLVTTDLSIDITFTNYIKLQYFVYSTFLLNCCSVSLLIFEVIQDFQKAKMPWIWELHFVFCPLHICMFYSMRSNFPSVNQQVHRIHFYKCHLERR